jgi:hypothetical protein
MGYEQQPIKVSLAGRLSIPAKQRRALGLEDGGMVMAMVQDGEFHAQQPIAFARGERGEFLLMSNPVDDRGGGRPQRMIRGQRHQISEHRIAEFQKRPKWVRKSHASCMQTIKGERLWDQSKAAALAQRTGPKFIAWGTDHIGVIKADTKMGRAADHGGRPADRVAAYPGVCSIQVKVMVGIGLDHRPLWMRVAVRVHKHDMGADDVQRRVAGQRVQLHRGFLRGDPVAGVQIDQPLAACGGNRAIVASAPQRFRSFTSRRMRGSMNAATTSRDVSFDASSTTTTSKSCTV